MGSTIPRTPYLAATHFHAVESNETANPGAVGGGSNRTVFRDVAQVDEDEFGAPGESLWRRSGPRLSSGCAQGSSGASRSGATGTPRSWRTPGRVPPGTGAARWSGSSAGRLTSDGRP